MGSRPEPYLPAVLESIAEAVDFVVVNDNSGDRGSCNRLVLEASSLWRKGRAGIVEAPFQGFASARNLCLDYIRSHGIQQPGCANWVMMVDCDEVHGRDVKAMTRTILPNLSSRVGMVDGYFVQFMQSYDYFISLDRRHNLLFRLNDHVGWYQDVHERLQGLEGERLCLPYVYCHYGYVMSNERILDKWQQYQKLGDRSYSEAELSTVETSRMFEHEIARCMPYSWGHPPAMQVLARDLMRLPDPSAERFRSLVAAYLHQPGPRCKALLRRGNYRLRILWRAFQAGVSGLHPRALPALLAMVF